ncbi:hypothetical protein F3Y22_tig00116964pilonHSYRG00116 [Hibiscus syriacus]|uniref:Subtilisin-like protease fibronectin type-III domain-containing protein n=1 Tax=Hibiscus syriacus TaxID=106335 RepID=A0A6A2WJC3_HIBSY|nr:hypothetical protein F3Y22_tig00116964pilonHSYRG00116 [Hibiscus syriacus]
MPPIPTRWKGKCQNSTINPFPCNKKLIGAQVFIKGSQAAAIEKGVAVVCAAGNDGEPNTHNAAPWITTVGAGTLDRNFTATVTLGNNQTFEGRSEFPNRVLVIDSSLYYGKSDFAKHGRACKKWCSRGILISDWTPYDIGELSIPSLVYQLLLVLRSESTLQSQLMQESRVLAAFPPTIPVQQFDNYDLASDYALLSGTSIPTTNLPGTPLDYGAGHINPNKAMDPGLIYDIDWQGYVDFLCGLGYNDTEMKTILRQSQWNCSHEGSDVNYPSFVAMFSTGSPNVKNFTRVVTNVGEDQSVYHAVVEITYGMTFRVEPTTLTFTNKIPKAKLCCERADVRKSSSGGLRVI